MKISKVLIVGGTHGNEPTGIYLMKKWQNRPEAVTRPDMKTHLLLANRRAEDLGRRYVDRDLNRCFLERDLADNGLTGHEDRLAKEIAAAYGPRPVAADDLIIDMHTTTADMGITLICDDSPGVVSLAGAVKARLPEVNIYCFDRKLDRIRSCLRSLAAFGLGIEIGPTPQNVLLHSVLEKMDRTVQTILDVTQEAADGTGSAWPEEVEVFDHLTEVAYPDQSACPDPVIHKDMEGHNYRPLQAGEPMFIGANGSLVCHQGPEGAVPVFVNEAAYYEKGIAFSLARRRRLRIA